MTIFATATLAAAPTTKPIPTFDQYPATPVTIETPVAVRLDSHPMASTFRTVLEEGAKKGPNFAGHYTVVTWGCGARCLQLAIIDARTGAVFFPPQTQPNAFDMVTDDSKPYEFRVDSRLLILTGSPKERDTPGVYYYRWTGSGLKQFHYVAKTWDPSAALEAIARDIEGLKGSYPQLADFSVARNLRIDRLSIDYAYRTHKPEPRGGWTSGVPNPDDDGIWFDIDFHDPKSTAEKHTQPAKVVRHCIGELELSFLHLEGTKTKSIMGDVWKILRKHGVTECR
ncbi:hypothetical protein BWI17_12340 [Betaproteobacteria bacterium GR16-43]|nr:hypothetical protein BWI17_12340 [Betaproteobacteria bacterium GR16-43]